VFKVFALQANRIGSHRVGAHWLRRRCEHTAHRRFSSRIEPGSKLNKACPSLAASGPVPDIGYVERFVRDGPRAALPGPSARGRRNEVRGQKQTDLAILADAAVRMKAMLRV
jgi:hypothetical protein